MMFLKSILTGLLASQATLAAQLTKVNYPNDASSKVDMCKRKVEDALPNWQTPESKSLTHVLQLTRARYLCS